MSKNIEFSWVIDSFGEELLSYKDLNITEKEWNNLTEEDKELICQEYLIESIKNNKILIYPYIIKFKTL